MIGPVSTMAPVPAGSIVMSPFVSEVIVPSAIIFKSPTAKVPVVNDPDTVVLPVVATSAVFNVPTTVVFGMILTCPVPDASSSRFAFEALVVIVLSAIEILSTVTVPVIVAALIVGAVRTLFVKV